MNPNAEPVSWTGAVTAVAVAAVPLLRAFGVAISQNQSDAILAFLAALIVLATLVVRSKVTPNAKAQHLIDEAYHADPKSEAKPSVKRGATSRAKRAPSGAQKEATSPTS